MTNLTEARLAREAELCYASLALVTDYDCWREATEDVSVETILAVLGENAGAARRALAEAVAKVEPSRGCGCRDAMRFGILTDRASIPDEARRRLSPIAGRYL
jgi:5'-methylthioadenosine phosphorylase